MDEIDYKEMGIVDYWNLLINNPIYPDNEDYMTGWYLAMAIEEKVDNKYHCMMLDLEDET